jgi:putative transposase
MLDLMPFLIGTQFAFASITMTQPREIIEGATYFLTRRILHRRFLLRPDAAMTHFILYSLAIAAERYKIEINTFCAMSTHVHLVVTDPSRNLPTFLRCFHHLIAMGVKVLRNWKGSVWDNARTSVVRLLTPEAIIEKIAYTLANPVAARAVQQAHQWSGAKNLVKEIGIGSRQVSRPKFYFNATSHKWPKEIGLFVKLPPMLVDATGLHRDVAERIAKEEKKARKNGSRRSNSKKHQASRISPYTCATGKETQFTRISTISVGQGNIDAYDKAIAASKAFRAAYRKALAKWQSGDRDVSFPQGTWWMREFHRANIDQSVTCMPSMVIR